MGWCGRGSPWKLRRHLERIEERPRSFDVVIADFAANVSAASHIYERQLPFMYVANFHVNKDARRRLHDPIYSQNTADGARANIIHFHRREIRAEPGVELFLCDAGSDLTGSFQMNLAIYARLAEHGVAFRHFQKYVLRYGSW